MRCVVRYLIVVTATASAGIATAGASEEPRVIPPKDIWAYDMPGTIPLHAAKRGTPAFTEASPFVFRIRSTLGFLSSKRDRVAGPAFIVAGDLGTVAERSALILEGKERRQHVFSKNSSLSLVFFAHESRFYVRIDDVMVHYGRISVRYRMVPHMTRESTAHFAIIPLGPLNVGD